MRKKKDNHGKRKEELLLACTFNTKSSYQHVISHLILCIMATC